MQHIISLGKIFFSPLFILFSNDSFKMTNVKYVGLIIERDIHFKLKKNKKNDNYKVIVGCESSSESEYVISVIKYSCKCIVPSLGYLMIIKVKTAENLAGYSIGITYPSTGRIAVDNFDTIQDPGLDKLIEAKLAL